MNSINYVNLFDSKANLVILGNPGAGKSLLSKAIVCAILNQEKGKFLNTDVFDRLPFRIELRKYLSFKKERKQNVLKYILMLLEVEYCIAGVPPKALDKLLRMGSIVFFDGLDEIFNVNDKIEIRNDIENFQQEYNALTVVTSRFIGYDEAFLDRERFVELQILPFSNGQIHEYLEKSYSYDEADDEHRKQDIDDFLANKSKVDKELLTNPLLLSLIVILHKNNIRIPSSKLEIYESCTRTLVDKWDVMKNLDINLDIELKKRKEVLLADLAHWQYEQTSPSGARITYDRVRSVIAESISHKYKLTDEWSIAERLAESFMNYVEKRSLYFDNNFTHKTFLEYFTAYWLYSNYEKKHKSDDRNAILAKHVGNPFWHIVFELLLNMIDKDQADTEVVDGILENLMLIGRTAFPFVIDVLPSLHNVDSKIVVRAFEIALAVCIDSRLEYDADRDSKNTRGHMSTAATAESLMSVGVTDSKIDALIEAFHSLLCEKGKKERKKELICLGLEMELLGRGKGKQSSLCTKLFDPEIALYSALVEEDEYLQVLDYFSSSKRQRARSFSEFFLGFVKKYGKNVAMAEMHGRYWDISIVAPVAIFIRDQLNPENISKLRDNVAFLESIGMSRLDLLKSLRKTIFVLDGGVEIQLILDEIEKVDDVLVRTFLILVVYTTTQRLEFAELKSKVDGRPFGDLILQLHGTRAMGKAMRHIARHLNLSRAIRKELTSFYS